ncbi:MAG: hypothetical protein EOP24_19170 [Hyphomicrobiales bacterium]|nr:MAG: hypothetical protein EOP24_19170 [Hyphomicrobiales bacterium]
MTAIERSNEATRFEYRGWQIDIKLADAADAHSCFAELSYRGNTICRVRLSMVLDARAVPWALDSKACDFIDRWSARQRHTARQPIVLDLDAC